MSAARGTTPTITLTFVEKGLDFTEMDHVYVTIEYNHQTLTKRDEDLEIGEKTISFILTQKETLDFPEMGNVRIQANWTKDGKRSASNIVNYSFGKQLLTEDIA